VGFYKSEILLILLFNSTLPTAAKYKLATIFFFVQLNVFYWYFPYFLVFFPLLSLEPPTPKSACEDGNVMKCIYIISVVTGATDGIGKEYARQVSDINSSSNAEQVGRVLNDTAADDGVAVASARKSLVD